MNHKIIKYKQHFGTKKKIEKLTFFKISDYNSNTFKFHADPFYKFNSSMKSIMKNSIKWILFSILQESDFEPVDNCLASVLSQEIELTDEFKANYGLWLHREVYNTEIQWELLLDESYQQKNQMVI